YLEEVSAPLLDRDRELRRRVDGRRRAGDDHAVGKLGLLEALVEDVGRDGLAEGHRVALQNAAAARAARRQLGEVDRLARIARDALDAADQGRVAVDLEQALAPRGAVQVVDVLRDRALEDAELLELDERLVTRVRARGGERLPQLAHGTGRVEALLPGAARVLQEALVAVHGWLAVPGPQAARATEGRDAALHRQAGPGERDHVARAGETLGRALEGIELPRFHRAAPGLSRRPPSVSTRAVRRAASVDRTERPGIWLPHERVGRGGGRCRRPRPAP